MNNEYLYIREDPIYREKLKVVKFGSTTKPVERDDQYATGEPIRGNFKQLYLILNKKCLKAEKTLQSSFKKYHNYVNGGTEFYKDDICDLIESIMDKENIQYEKVDFEDIKRIQSQPITPPDSPLCVKKETKLRDYQISLKEKAIEYYKNNKKGIINWCCGLGKTIIACELSSIYFKNYLLIGVYNKGLIEQWIEELNKFYDLPYLIIGSYKNSHTCTTDESEINKWFLSNPKGIIITMYQSSNKLLNINKIYDFAIFDECHHLTWIEGLKDDGTNNVDILKLNIKKQLGLTATIKKIETPKKHIDNTCVEWFGEKIDEKSVLWAIENKYITDYQLLTPKITKEELEDIIQSNKDIKGVPEQDYYLYFSAYLALFSIATMGRKKILIFTNGDTDMKKIYKYIIKIYRSMFPQLDIPFIEYTNNDTSLSELVNRLNKANSGIFINIYKVGEGINIPSLDTVLFSDNMGSTIRITQSCLRPNRLDIHNSNKIANIIIPLIYEEDGNYKEEDGDLKIKTFPIVMKTIEELSVSDYNIMNRIKAMKITKTVPKGPREPKSTSEFFEDVELYENIKLRTIKRKLLGKRTFPYIKKHIYEMGGRTDLTLSLEEDYRNNKQFKNGLPDIEWTRNYIFTSDKTWFDLYQIDISNYISWEEFNKKFNGYPECEYIPSDIYPNYSDLEELYRNYGYSPLKFWENINDSEF